MESFWSALKTEWVYPAKYATREEARRAIFEYIEMFYNRVKRHSSLGFVSPEAFEAGMS
jgi:putative transposase